MSSVLSNELTNELQGFGTGTLYFGTLDESLECQGADSGGYNNKFNEYPHSLVMSLYIFKYIKRHHERVRIFIELTV